LYTIHNKKNGRPIWFFAKYHNFQRNNSKNVEKKNDIILPLSPQFVKKCPSCDERLVHVICEYHHECPKCLRIFEWDSNYETLQEEEKNRMKEKKFLSKNILSFKK